MHDSLKGFEIKYNEGLQQLAKRMRPCAFLHAEATELEDIANAERKPFNVALYGKVEVGKSTLINALVGKPLTIVGVNETTATINLLTYATGDQLNTFVIHWKNQPPQTENLSKLKDDWSGTDDDVLDRIKRVSHLELHSNLESLKDIQIIDTPGHGSTVDEHEQIGSQIVTEKAIDALIYVVDRYALMDDKRAIDAFIGDHNKAKSHNNVVVVMHKWDDDFYEIYKNGGARSEIENEAESLYAELKDKVEAVQAVSGPLALLSKIASHENYWPRVLEVIKEFQTLGEEVFIETLDDDYLYTDDEEELAEEEEQLLKTWGNINLFRRLRNLAQLAADEYKLPTASFRASMLYLFRTNPTTTDEARAAIRTLSGIDAFEKTLKERIFTRQAIIRESKRLVRTKNVRENTLNRIDNEKKKLQDTISKMEEINKKLDDPQLHDWVSAQIESTRQALSQVESIHKEFDELYGNITKDPQFICNRHELLQMPLPHPPFSAEEASLIKTILTTEDISVIDRDKRKSILNGILGKICGQCHTGSKTKMDELRRVIIKIINEASRREKAQQ